MNEPRIAAGWTSNSSELHTARKGELCAAVSAAGEAELAGWLDGVLISDGGAIAATAPLFRTEKTISLHDYQSTTRLQLDHFTPEEDEPQQP